MNEVETRERICLHAKSLHDRGYTCGSSGNISVLVDRGVLVTPTNSCFGRLDPERLSLVDRDGNHLDGDRPSKELPMHLAVYRSRPGDRAVVHLHSSAAVAVSCLAGLNLDDALPPLTAYFVMRIGRLPLTAFHPPGDALLAESVGEAARQHRAILLSNHGPVVSGVDLDDAVYAAEELEETARIYLTLRDRDFSPLSLQACDELRRRFGQQSSSSPFSKDR
ncbi:L-fuculose phosphate aldolase [Caulifigura coniformis]|uniref:3-oxo-tetronate 4-phosphate decarboxylase n=1 Tax=Caulifigura coniformis TaxID=2527983 RepID=A0A517SIF0_9PLAN|nr:3-oxo-tetronate 4-phosphate decarboxylase [Caulifigura coniformis]QDT55890.1 L-fuculose phosphate aldolase [Caulifigura coniformis]